MKHLFFTVSAFLLAMLPQTMACVGCRQPEVTSIEEPQTIMAGVAFSWSVLTMLAIVSLIVSGLTVYIARTCQRVDQEKQRSQ